MIAIGLIGKTNTGKTTFFNSATLLNAEISTYPFTTKQPNTGTAYIRMLCVCRELGVKDNPQNSACIEGWRFIPIELIDLPGLIRGAWMGKGLGNQFLSVATKADALIHIVDASGSIDQEGRLCKPGTGNPVQDVYDVEEELTNWFVKVIQSNKADVIRQIRAGHLQLDESLHKILTGLKVEHKHITDALKHSKLRTKDFTRWSDGDIKNFARRVREESKPTLILANKMDLPHAEENYEALIKEFTGTFVIPCSAESELALRRAEKMELIKYIPGEEIFRITNEKKLTPRQLQALEYVSERVFSKWMRTGVQFALNTAVFKLLRTNTVYPVYDEKRLSDKHGNVLPDVFLIQEGATALDLARQIHTELARTMIHATDARTGLRLPKDYVLRDRDIIKIVAVAKKRAN